MPDAETIDLRSPSTSPQTLLRSPPPDIPPTQHSRGSLLRNSNRRTSGSVMEVINARRGHDARNAGPAGSAETSRRANPPSDVEVTLPTRRSARQRSAGATPGPAVLRERDFSVAVAPRAGPVTRRRSSATLATLSDENEEDDEADIVFTGQRYNAPRPPAPRPPPDYQAHLRNLDRAIEARAAEVRALYDADMQDARRRDVLSPPPRPTPPAAVENARPRFGGAVLRRNGNRIHFEPASRAAREAPPPPPPAPPRERPPPSPPQAPRALHRGAGIPARGIRGLRQPQQRYQTLEDHMLALDDLFGPESDGDDEDGEYVPPNEEDGPENPQFERVMAEIDREAGGLRGALGRAWANVQGLGGWGAAAWPGAGHFAEFPFGRLNVGVGLGGVGGALAGVGRAPQIEEPAVIVGRVKTPEYETPPGFRATFEIPELPVVLDENGKVVPPKGKQRRPFIACSSCEDQLLLSTAYRGPADGVHVLRCGHMLDHKCLERIAYPADGVLPGAQPLDEEPKTKKRRTPARKKAEVRRYEWMCPVKGCGLEHWSVWKDGAWSQDEVEGALQAYA